MEDFKQIIKIKDRKIRFTPLEKDTDFSRWSLPYRADGGFQPDADLPLAEMPPSAQAARPVRKEFSNGVKEPSSLTGFTALSLGFSVFLLFTFSACIPKSYTPYTSKLSGIEGFNHEVKPGETLWRISEKYGINLEDIVAENRLPDATKIEVGQLIFIPVLKKIEETDKYNDIYKTDEGFIWPVKGKVISFYGSIKDTLKNKGIDIQAKEGTKINAARSGMVTFCDFKVRGYGKIVIIDHNDGFSTIYAHNSEILVKSGQMVKQGQTIAKVGSTGRTSVPQLHFEIRKGHSAQNPFYYLP